ncbi:hypothetical protein LMH87_001734 [Akanthomyces muscarius]|uniref:Uncharacterized protein n=1 Tax=Akanthomyces muscarius TaxID=2231603 RepID=A0A9W8Q5G2_AKAMU|nr:hypothetical protein LMH87_001734 [Akanthomyces muscarius]KAJ4147194.1 hypothetical protein LMH87_001734 [Akanthomyces muscarius]
MHAFKVFATFALAATAYASPAEASHESEEPLAIARVGCKQQGTPSRPAMCHKPRCPSNRKSVFWDYGCRDGSWTCCI